MNLDPLQIVRLQDPVPFRRELDRNVRPTLAPDDPVGPRLELVRGANILTLLRSSGTPLLGFASSHPPELTSIFWGGAVFDNGVC